jgi:hypothetical protein
VLTTPRDPYALVLPGPQGPASADGLTGRANMIAPLRQPVQIDTTLAAD